ncbi:adenosylhomocysteinase isoform X3 [Eucalyptus grandis]|uniref:adenosylhomocysteinase isoform X3 n=1 Tax=Eucalyptus grandis TaxID=71139 RepID=UPI00192EF0D6|nr:adenosylhomocysteinase isoform X3 [Eucalyptus grandis]
MALSVERAASRREYKVKDMSQADFGRLQIELAEVQMPALMSFRSVFGPSQPLKGARISGYLHMTPQTAVLIETLTALGAEVRWCSSNAFSTQDHAAAAIARDSAGIKAEEAYKKTGNLPDPASTNNPELQILLTIIRDGMQTDPKRYHKMKEGLVGVSEATATAVERLYGMQAHGTLLFPVINVNDCVTKTKFQNLCGCRPSGPDGLLMAADVEIAGKVAVVCGYGVVGKDRAAALKEAGARVIVTEIDPICALQAVNEGIQVQTLEDVVSEADIFVVTAGSSKGIIMVDHMRKMKNNAIICNVGPFDNAIDMLGLETFPGVKRITFNPQTDRWVFPDTQSGVIVLAEGRLVNLGHATGHPCSVTSSCSFANHAMAQLELWMERDTGKYEKKVYVLPKHLDEKVAALHLGKLGAKLTKPNKEHAD